MSGLKFGLKIHTHILNGKSVTNTSLVQMNLLKQKSNLWSV